MFPSLDPYLKLNSKPPTSISLKGLLEPFPPNNFKVFVLPLAEIFKAIPSSSPLSNLDFLTIGPGDIIHVASGGAGGWGNPLKRHLKLVQQDVQRGFVSQDSAKKLYGVILNKVSLEQVLLVAHLAC